MGNWNISSNSAASIVNGAPVGIDNDGGTIRNAGSVVTTRFQTQNLDATSERITITSGVGGNRAILPGGTFNNNANELIRGYSTTVAGLSNTKFANGASNSANLDDSIHQMNVLGIRYYKSAIRSNKWNEFSGAWDSTYPQVANSGAWNIAGGVDNSATLVASGTDNAANPSQAVPGELAYFGESGNHAITDEYHPRTLW